MPSDTGIQTGLPFPRFQRGKTTLELHGRRNTIMGLTKGKTCLLIQDEETAEPETLSPERFWKLYGDNELELDDHAFDQLPERFRSALETVEPTVARDGWAAFRRFKYIVAADNAGASKTDRGLQPIIDAIAGEIKDPEPPDPKTLATWMRERGVPGKRFARFMRDLDDQKGRTDWLGTEENLITEETIEIYYKNNRKLRPSEIIEAVGGEIAKRNATLRGVLEISHNTYNEMAKTERQRLGFLIEPHSTTIGRRLARHEGYATTKSRDGKKATDALYIPVRKPPIIATFANQVWYIDHTRLDGHLAYDAKTKIPLGRPWLTIVVDAYSRLIVGFFISFIPPSIHSVSLALKNAINSKHYVRQAFPDIDRPWLAFGLPDVVVCDRALEFTGQSFELACAEFGIEVVWCPRKNPQWKGIIERTNRTINTNFVELMPGSTKGDPRTLTKQERDPAAEAEISHEELNKEFHKWVICVYPRKTNTGLGDRPGDVYERSIHQEHPRMPRKTSDLAVFGMTFWRTLDRKGLQFLILRYSHPKRVFEILDRAGKPKVKVCFTVDPGNMGAVVVRDPTTGERIVLPCTDQERAQGTSLWEHRNSLKWMRLRNYDPADRERWLIAKKEIRDSFMARLLNKKGKLATRTTATREAKIGEPTYANPTVLNELYSDENDQDWLKQEFVQSESVDPYDIDKYGNGDFSGASATPDNDPADKMSRFGRKQSRRGTKAKGTGAPQAQSPTESPTPSDNDSEAAVVEISETSAADEHQEKMASMKRPNFNRKKVD
jgi:putative transposase